MDMSYAITDEAGGDDRRSAELRYVGPAPVTIEEFTDQVNLQKLTNELLLSSASARRWAT